MILFRTATLDDARLLFEWRNDPLTREMSKNKESVPWDDHLNWLTNRLLQGMPRLYVAYVDGVPVGTFRIDRDEISYTIAPEHRGRGCAKGMLLEARKSFGNLQAEIYERNIASIKTARFAGINVRLLTSD